MKCWISAFSARGLRLIMLGDYWECYMQKKVSRLIPFVPFYNFFLIDRVCAIALHCNIIGNELSMCLLTTLKVFKYAVVCTFTWVIECIAKGLQRFLFVFDILFFFLAFHCVMCAYVFNNSCTTKCQGTNTYAHIMIFGCTLTFRHSISTYISRGVFLGGKFSSLDD
jgi:hypothetical protein